MTFAAAAAVPADPQTVWLGFASVVVTQVVTLVVALVGGRDARKAKRNTAPVSNGFARDVVDRLDGIDERLDTGSRSLDLLHRRTAHNGRRIDRLAHRIDEHVKEHA